MRGLIRRRENYLFKKLGALGADLELLAGFFDPPRGTPVGSTTHAHQALLLHEAGFRLRGLGRLEEAVEPLRASINASVAIKEWALAALGAINLSELRLALGLVAEAIALAKQSVDHADQSNHARRWVASRTTYGAASHQSGQRSRAEALFEEV